MRKSDRLLVVVLFCLSVAFLVPSFVIISYYQSLVYSPGIQQSFPILGLLFLLLFFLFLARPEKSNDDEEAEDVEMTPETLGITIRLDTSHKPREHSG